jgi:ATP-dependent exoDNAse (exonuclease V) beta subunit
MSLKFSNDRRVSFEESTHTYTLDGEKRLTSITQYISKFKALFDKDRISKAYAEKHGRTQADVLAEWKKKADDSCTMGTYVHQIFEDFINGKEITEIDDVTYPKSKVAIEVINDLFLSGRLTPVATELIVYNEEYAGQIDCLAKDKDGNVYILDWKTNAEIKQSNSFQSMTGKFWIYDDCNFTHYSIQLRAYQSMIKEFDVSDCFIIHIKEDDYEIIRARDIEPF